MGGDPSTTFPLISPGSSGGPCRVVVVESGNHPWRKVGVGEKELACFLFIGYETWGSGVVLSYRLIDNVFNYF